MVVLQTTVDVIVVVVVQIVVVVVVREGKDLVPVIVVVLDVGKIVAQANVLSNGYILFMYTYSRILILIIIGLFVLTMSVAIFIFGGSHIVQTEYASLSAEERIALHSAAELTQQGLFKEASDALRVLASSETDSLGNMLAQASIETSNFLSGESDAQIRAVESAKHRYLVSADYPPEQVRIINELLAYIGMNSVGEDDVYDAIFSNEPFSHLRIDGDRAGSLRALAEYSYELSPTTDALFRIAWWHADRLLNIYGSWEVSETEKVSHRTAIQKMLTQAEMLVVKEKEATALRQNPMLMPRYHFWRSTLFGVLARFEPIYFERMGAERDLLRALYESSGALDGTHHVGTAILVPYVDLYYAQALYEHDPEDVSWDMITPILDDMITVVDTNPAIHRAGVLKLFAHIASLSPEEQQRQYAHYVAFAKAVPSFSDFLSRSGVAF